MVVAWWIAAALLIVAIVLFFAHRKAKQEVKRQQVQIANLMSRLSSTRYELKEVNARRKKLLTASTQALIIVEKDFKISSANKVAKRLFGKPHKEATLMSWIRQHKLQELVSQTMQGNKMPTVYFTAGDHILEANARYIKQKKKITAVALAVHDITELQKLSRSQRDFITNISHELRTPLASIQLLTDTLINGGLEEPAMAASLINKIAIQVDTLNQLAQEVLDLSLIESGKVPLRMSNHPLHSIVEGQLVRYLPQAERKNVCLEMDVDQQLSVLVDDKMIGRVISNLIHNAIKFTNHGKIMVSAHRLNGDLPPQISDSDDEWVQISVSDTGIGLSNEEIERIFERFYKVNQARNRSKGESSGTGLGLAIAKHIIEAHGGAIWAEQNEQEGATFHFTLHTEN